MPGEFSGRILHVNLTTGVLEVEHPPESFYRTYLGGSAMGLHYILREMKPGTDGLDPDNVLTVMDSLLTGRRSPARAGSPSTPARRSPTASATARPVASSLPSCASPGSRGS